ncbi:discoidin domain-containing protein [Pseudomonas sp. NFXW11]|uniref:discoidin domain-containing protein n=1 Tax=Pseudomonas sp. NFXW11 TaxID=2819531 RepID=UPI003CEDEEDD
MSSFRLNALSHATRLWMASLGTAVLLPMGGMALANEAPLPVPHEQDQTLIKGHFINVQALQANPMQRSASEAGTDQLLQETGMRIRQLIPRPEDSFKDLRVLTGQLEGRARSLAPPGEIFLAARPDGSFLALLPDAKAMIRGQANGEQALIRLDDKPSFAPSSIDYVQGDASEQPGQQETRSGQRSFQSSRNAQGETVIDLLAGFSQKSADWAGDHEAYALAQVAAVNRALKQSRVQGVRIRLVGTQVLAKDYPIVGPSLGYMSDAYAEGMRKYSPDVVAGFFIGDPKVDTGVGWAYAPGRYTVNRIQSSTVFRHELGHNIGGGHCYDGNGYRFGYNNGRVGTILCGNDVAYFSNPDLKDNLGAPLGDARTANMARMWRENAPRMSAYSPSVVPLEGEQASSILEQRVTLSKNQTQYYPLDVPEGTQRLVFTVVDGERTEDNGEVQLLLKRGSQPTSSSYDYRSVRHYNVSLGVDNPQPGRWYMAIGTNHNPTQDLVLEGHAYGRTQDSAQGRYLKLVATSSVDGKDNASIAELLLADAKGQELPRNSWKVISSSSAMAEGTRALDGNPASYWSSAPGARYPHELVIDLGANSRFSQLHYLPRQDAGQSGNIKGYQVYGSDSPSGAWTLLADGQFSADNQLKATALKPVEATKPPVVQISGKTQAEAGEQIVLDASASSDPQGHALSYSWEASPKLDFHFDGARISFTAPKLREDTLYRFTLTLSNGKQTVTREHQVKVQAETTPAVKPPVIDLKGVSETLSGKPILLDASKSSDPGNLPLTYQWSVTPSSTNLVAKPLGHTLSLVPGMHEQDQDYRVTLTLSNGHHSVTREHLLKVKGYKPTEEQPPVTLPPIAQISGATRAKAGTSVTLDASASSDPASLPLSYQWSVTPQVAFQASGAKLTFVAPKNEKQVSYRFTLTLNNGKHSVSREHSVTVAAEQVQTPAGCQGPWSPQGTYWANDKVSHLGRFYIARWWTRNNEPGNPSTTGPDYSGKVWRDAGACN